MLDTKWNQRTGFRILAATVALVGVAALASPATAKTNERGPSSEETGDVRSEIALFEGTEIDLGGNWGDAIACLAWGDSQPECFRTESAMDARIVELGGTPTGSTVLSKAAPEVAGPTTQAAAASCSSSLRLYKNSNYGGSVLSLYNRNGWINLSSYGFNQSVSSYKVGACDSRFADWNNGGGALYASWRTNAYDAASSMTGGWDNDVSSVRIY